MNNTLRAKYFWTQNIFISLSPPTLSLKDYNHGIVCDDQTHEWTGMQMGPIPDDHNKTDQ